MANYHFEADSLQANIAGEMSQSAGINAAQKDCPMQDLTREEVTQYLRRSGLRPTRQRIALSDLLFGKGGRHITAEALHEEAVLAKIPVSMATIYNTLHHFTQAGLLREVAVDGAKTYFDTNTSNHHHFYHEDTGHIYDIDTDEMKVVGIPTPPEGQEVWRIDVIVRLKDI